MYQRTFQHKFIYQHVTLYKLVVEATRTILQGIKRGDRKRLWHCIVDHIGASNPALLYHAQLAWRWININEQWTSKTTHRNQRLAGCQVWKPAPERIVYNSERTLEPADHVGITNLVENVVIDQPQYFV